ncbi:MAG: HEAT repeat domain-containing protein [Fibrobacteria bacterium]|nr:HEAT repeat domain-containing protein [Fibrobacteria bacterium]
MAQETPNKSTRNVTMNEKIINSYLNSPDERKKLNAVAFLEKSGNLTHLKPIMVIMKTAKDSYLKKSACICAAAIIKRNLVNNYCMMTPKMRRQLSQILQKLDPQVIDSLAEDLRHKNEDTRFNAIRVLSMMGRNPQIRTVVKGLVTDRNEMIRATAVSLLKQLTDSVDASLIAILLKDSDKRVVANTVEVIEEIAQPNLVPLLVQLKSDPINRIRGNVYKALWKLGHNIKEIHVGLKEMIEDKDNYLMRASGCWVIGECAEDTDFEFLEILAGCANDPEKLVRENVIKAQIKIGGDAIEIYQKRLSNPKEVAEVRKLIQDL